MVRKKVVSPATSEHLNPLYGRVWNVFRSISEAIHKPFVLIGKEAKQCQQTVAKDICNSIWAPKFQRRSKATFEHVSPTPKFD